MVQKPGRTHSRDYTSQFVNAITDNLGDSFRDRWLARNLMSKFVDADPRKLRDREEAALEKWLSVERRNSKTNMRLYLDDTERVIGGCRLDSVLERARRIVRRLLGVTPHLADLHGRFSGGASTSKRRQLGMVARKFAERPDVTQEAWDIVWPVVYRSTLWTTLAPDVLNPRFVEANVMFHVPKNDSIERTCAKEPDLNLYMQKACGDFIRRALRLVGVNLNDQSINRRLAREGSIDGSLATLDLSSASDSVTTQLVLRLLPHDWFCLLDSLRCKNTVLPDGTIHENEMFSSMGNGFTFELESLIFYAIAKATCVELDEHRVVSVYGDDIIVPGNCAKPLALILGFCGFKVNLDKSFIEGPFRESCGGHYYKGVDVTPFYIKEPITHLSDVIHTLNSLRAWASRESSWADASWYETWRILAKLVPDRNLFGGHDLTSKETVASASGPAYRYMQVRKTLRLPELEVGSYLEWLHNAEDRWCLSENSHSQIKETSVYRVVKTRKHSALHFGLAAPVFPQELLSA